jgi:hypothetical protein
VPKWCGHEAAASVASVFTTDAGRGLGVFMEIAGHMAIKYPS